MENLQVFNNKSIGLKVRTLLNGDGSISINAEDAAIGYGWTTVAKSGNVTVRWERVNGYCDDLGFPSKLGKDDYIPESLFYLLGMKANNEAAKAFQKWLACGVIPTIRKTGGYSINTGISASPGEIANLMREFRLWAAKQNMPPAMAMESMVKFMKLMGIPFPQEMVYKPESLQLTIFNIQLPV